MHTIGGAHSVRDGSYIVSYYGYARLASSYDANVEHRLLKKLFVLGCRAASSKSTSAYSSCKFSTDSQYQPAVLNSPIIMIDTCVSRTAALEGKDFLPDEAFTN